MSKPPRTQPSDYSTLREWLQAIALGDTPYKFAPEDLAEAVHAWLEFHTAEGLVRHAFSAGVDYGLMTEGVRGPVVPDEDEYVRLLFSRHPDDEKSARDAIYRSWWLAQKVDLRDLMPPPGACLERIHRPGDPSTPCVLALDHDGECEDLEGYRSWGA